VLQFRWPSDDGLAWGAREGEAQAQKTPMKGGISLPSRILATLIVCHSVVGELGEAGKGWLASLNSSLGVNTETPPWGHDHTTCRGAPGQSSRGSP
jgi:hypothetical protein